MQLIVLQEIQKIIVIVAISAAISIIVSLTVLDYRYKDALNSSSSLELPSFSEAEIREKFRNSPKLLAYDIISKSYFITSEPNDFERSLFVFSDFNCIYCQKDDDKYINYSIQNKINTIYYIETPILGEDSKSKALLSTSDYLSDIKNYDRSIYYSKTINNTFIDNLEAEEILKDHSKLVSSFRINATPTYIIKGQFQLGLQ